MGLRIVTDSTSDLPISFLQKHNITMVPLTVNFSEESFLDKVEITPNKFFEKLEKSENLPTTSQVSPGEFVREFNEILQSGDEILGIFLARELSGTVESAQIAKDIIGSDKIHIVDSKSVCLGLGTIIIKAIELVNDGLDVNDIVKILKKSTENIKTAIVVDTLKYLEKGGRLSKKAAVFGSLLNVKPILEIKDGKVLATDKVRGMKKGLQWIEKWIDKNEFDLSNKSIVLVNAKSLEIQDKLKTILIEKYNAKQIIESEVGAVVGTHAGPGCIGMAFLNE